MFSRQELLGSDGAAIRDKRKLVQVAARIAVHVSDYAASGASPRFLTFQLPQGMVDPQALVAHLERFWFPDALVFASTTLSASSHTDLTVDWNDDSATSSSSSG